MSTIVLVAIFVLVNAAIIVVLYTLWERRHSGLDHSPQASEVFHRAVSSAVEQLETTKERVEYHIAREQRLVDELNSIANDRGVETSELTARVVESSKDLRVFVEFLRQLTSTFDAIGTQFEDSAAQTSVPIQVDAVTTEISSIDSASHHQDADSNLDRALDALDSIQNAGAEREQRKNERELATFPLSVLPLTADLNPLGEPIEGIARELSRGGMSFSHLEPLESPMLALELLPKGTDEIYLILDRRHTELVRPFYVTGGEFVDRLESLSLIRRLRMFRRRREGDFQCH